MSESYEVLKKQYDDLKNKKLFGNDIFQAAANHYEPIIAELVQAANNLLKSMDSCNSEMVYQAEYELKEVIAKHTVK